MRFVVLFGLLLWGCASSSSTPPFNRACQRDVDCQGGEYCAPASKLCLPRGECLESDDCAIGERCSAGMCEVPAIRVELFQGDTSLLAFNPTVLNYDLQVGFLGAELTLRTDANDDIADITWLGRPIAHHGDVVLKLQEQQLHQLQIRTVTNLVYNINISRSGITNLAQRDRLQVLEEESGRSEVSAIVDGDTLIIGDPTDDVVRIYEREPAGWSLQQELRGHNTEDRDRFGAQVSLDGDTMVVSAEREDSGARGVDGDGSDNSLRRSGAAYVFVRSGNEWHEQAYLKASNPDAYDHFGVSVAVDADTVAVGAYTEDGGGSGVNNGEADNSLNRSGAVYVFERTGDTWHQEAYLKGSTNTEEKRYLGHVLALDGDTIAALAARSELYLFRRKTSGWSQEAKITFGEGSSLHGTVALDGDTVVAIAGSTTPAQVYTREGQVWSFGWELRSGAEWLESGFGSRATLAIRGDLIAIGSPTDRSALGGVNIGDPNSQELDSAGAVYLFAREGIVWSRKAYIKAANPHFDERFGRSITLSAERLVVGGFAVEESRLLDGSRIHFYTLQ